MNGTSHNTNTMMTQASRLWSQLRLLDVADGGVCVDVIVMPYASTRKDFIAHAYRGSSG